MKAIIGLAASLATFVVQDNNAMQVWDEHLTIVKKSMLHSEYLSLSMQNVYPYYHGKFEGLSLVEGQVDPGFFQLGGDEL